jgi:hypothetical protein
MILEVRILNELCGRLVDVRILQRLANLAARAVNRRRRGIVGDLMRRTRGSLAREYQLAKYYLGNGENWGLSGRWEV